MFLLVGVPAHAAGPVVSLSPTSLTFGTQFKGTTSPAQVVTLTNTGTASLSLSSIKISSYFADTNTCQASLAVGASCTISVTFTPGSNGTVTGTVTFADNASGSPQTVALSGTGTIASLSPATLTFGNQTVGIPSSTQTITLTNSGQAAVKVTAVTLQGANPGDFSQTNNCASVSGGGNCAISVIFTPTVAGSRTATVGVTFASSVSPVPATVTGTGVNIPLVTFSPLSLTFGNQPLHSISAAQNVTLTNTGGAALSITSISITGANSGDFVQTNTCGSSVAAGAACIVSIQFQPTATGTRTGSLSVADNASGSPQTVAFTGTAPNPNPFLQQPLNPTTAAAGSSAFTLTVNGAGFVSGATILWNGSSRGTTFVSSDQLQAAILASDVASAGTARVTVKNPTPGGGTSNTQYFQITSPTASVSMSQTVLGVGADPRGVGIADFNGDGIPDVAVVSRATDTILIWLGKGDGTFTSGANYATGDDPMWIAVGDFNGDGIADLVTANRASYTISVLLGNGDGTFKAHADYSAGTEPIAVAVGDFNGDGYLDVADLNAADNTISIFFGSATGVLQAGPVLPVGGGPIAIVVGDFNFDGILDLATANSGTNNVSILLGSGGGNFLNATSYATGTDPDGLFTADVNGDGKLDLVTANNGNNTISVLLNNGSGAFAANVNYSVGSLPFAIAGGDFFGNGLMDLVVVNSGNNTVSIVPGNSNGTFNPSQTLTFPVGNQALNVAVADLNLDGRPDLIISNSTDNTISVLLQVPGIALSTTGLAFGSQMVGSSSAAQPVTLTNSGSAALVITTVSITGTNASQYSQTNNCGTSLAAGATCTVNVTFAPNASGTASASLSFSDNAAGTPQAVSLLATGVTPAAMLSAASLTFTSQIVNTTSPAQVVMLTNTGSSALTITSIAASTAYGVTNTCGSSVAAGAACNISVTFTPTATGTTTGTVTVTDNAGVQTISLTGTGASAPAVGLSPSSLTFVSQIVDTSSAAQTFTLTNSGAGPLTVTSITTTGDYSQTNTCGTSVNASATCTISVVFTPTATGTRSGTVVVTDNASNSPQSVTMNGTGATPTIAYAPTSLSFGNQAVNTTSAVKVIKLTNNTGAKFTISKVAASTYFAQTNNCGTGGGAGGSCTINVTFTPTSSGAVTGTITITDSASNSPQTVPLSGTGTSPIATLSPSSLTFADQSVGSSSAASSITLSNTGSATLTISSVGVGGTNSSEFAETNNCGGVVAAGGSCTINTTFTPAASGTRTANISVTDSATGSPQSVALTGTGIASAVSLSPTSVSFAAQPVGTASAVTSIALSNSGSAALPITSISFTGTNSGDFAQTNNCSASLPAATSCKINVTFTPAASGARAASLSISDNAAGSPQTVALSGTGSAPAVSFSATSITFGNQALGTSSPASGVTLFNTGNASLSITSITDSGANAGDFSESNNCGLSLAAGASCNINTIFSPTGAGSRSATVSVVDNAPGSPQLIALSGTGTSGGPAAGISPSSLTFASQNLTTTSPAQAVTLTNSGASALSITGLVASGDFAQTNNCGTSLAAAASCAVNVTFSPSFNGTRTGYITFTDSDPSTLQTVTLTGTGGTPSSTVTIAPVQASVTPGQSAQFTSSISGVVSNAVTWAVDAVTGGNSTVGTISTTGLYTAPGNAGSHVITATTTSKAKVAQSASVPVVVTSYAGTFVYHNDNGRTGQNLSETVLTTGNVNSAQFGKLFSDPVDGQIYGEPLYVQGVSVSGQGTHNVVYVVTENDSVYAFDADGSSTSPLWKANFLTGGAQTLSTSDIGGCANISPQVGISSTPVIDPVSKTIYVLARTKTVVSGVTNYYQTLYALDITSGAILQSTQIQASVTTSSGTVTFNPQTQNQRAGLFLLNGAVYIAWAAHCDIQPFHGWLIGYEETNLQQVAVYNTTPNGVEGGIWQSGAAPAVDEYGNIYAMIGNGTFDVNVGGVDYGEGLVKLSLSGNSLPVVDYFVPSNYATLNSSDLDLGSGGPLLIPTQTTAPTNMLVAAGKQGMVYLINQTNLGQYNANTNNVIQTLPAGTVPTAHSMPAYWQNNVYFAGVGSYAQSYLLSNGLLSTSATSQSPETFGYPGATPAISANGSSNGILWAISTVQGFPILLRVYDAANLSRELYNSDQIESRDQGGMAVKFAVPTIANGKVYIGTATEVDVYGLLPQP